MSIHSELASNVANRLAQTTLTLVDKESVSGSEAAIADLVVEMCNTRRPSLTHDDSLFYGRTAEADRPFVVFAGHLDTVPSQDNLPGRIEGDAVHGLGASDMKGALAVMIELLRWFDEEDPPLEIDAGFLFFAREELSVEQSPITGLLGLSEELRGADLVVVMEPTSNAIQLGCLGNINTEITFKGKSAHSARPWFGDNAIHRAIAGLQEVAASSPKEVSVEGLSFREVVGVTGIEGGLAANVIPDRAICHINYRYAPNRTPEEAEAELRSMLPGEASLAIAGNAPPARVAMDNPLVECLRKAGGAAVEPKQAWTNVAEFSAAGIDAVNFGPGAPEYAHRRDEMVSIAALAESLDSLKRFLRGLD